MNKFLFISLFVLGSAFASQYNRDVDIKILFYHTPQDFTAYPLDVVGDITKHPSFHVGQRTVLYIHGYMETPETPLVQEVIKAYHKSPSHDYNVLVLDWSDVSTVQYVKAALATKMIGKAVAKALSNTKIVKDHQAHQLHLVGYNLGAHLAGYIGYSLQKQGTQIERITGLDPALLMFYPDYLKPLDYTDAKYVDIIHTDANNYGIPVATGHFDFWPNAGITLQPGCPKRNYVPMTSEDMCSTRRSVYYWIEALKAHTSNSFLAVRAKSWKDFKNGHVDKHEVVVMGPLTVFDESKFGNYFLQTEESAPFYKGSLGIVYDLEDDEADSKFEQDSDELHWSQDQSHRNKFFNKKYVSHDDSDSDSSSSSDSKESAEQILRNLFRSRSRSQDSSEEVKKYYQNNRASLHAVNWNMIDRQFQHQRPRRSLNNYRSVSDSSESRESNEFRRFRHRGVGESFETQEVFATHKKHNVPVNYERAQYLGQIYPHLQQQLVPTKGLEHIPYSDVHYNQHIGNSQVSSEEVERVLAARQEKAFLRNNNGAFGVTGNHHSQQYEHTQHHQSGQYSRSHV